jgi:hypothetical protein
MPGVRIKGGSANRAEQNCSRQTAGFHSVARQWVIARKKRGATDFLLLDLYLMAKYGSNGYKDPNCFGSDFGTDPIPWDSGDV